MGRVTAIARSVMSVTGVTARGAKLNRSKICRKVAFPLLASVLSGGVAAALKGLQTYVDDDDWIEENLFFDSTAYGSFGTCMSFMMVFRTAQSYTRYWDGIDMVYGIMGHWFNAASNTLAFTRCSKVKAEEVENFRRLVVRLFSLLNCLMLRELEGQEVHAESGLKFPVLDPRGIDQQTRAHLLNMKSHSRPEQVFQAISKVVVEAQQNGIIASPPPIVERIHQEMGLGMTKLQNAMKLASVDFPAPYNLAIVALLSVHMLLTPVAVIAWAKTVAFSGFFSFVLVFCMFGLMQLAAELDNPFRDSGFGFDKDLVQQKLNKALVTILLEERRPECSGSATNCQACYGIATLTPAGGGQTCSCPNSTFWIKAPEGEGGCGRCKACSTGGTCQTCDKSPRKCTSCIKSHFLLDDSCLKTCPNNHLAQDGRCQKLIGAVVSFSRSKQLLTAASCSDQSVACAVKGEVQGAQASPTQQWIIADGGDDTMVLRNFQDGSLMNVTSEGTLKHCWPDHGTAACYDMPGSVQFRSVVSEEGQLGLLSVSTSRYLILADLIDFSEEMSVKAAVPGGAWLHPTILVKQPFTAALRYYDHCDTPIQSELECKLAAAQQGVIRYSQFSPWNGDSSFPPYCFYLTETVNDLAVTRLVLNIKAGAAKRSYLRYQQCSKTTPCLCKS